MSKLALIAMATCFANLRVADAKPIAPVTVELHARAVTGGYEITLVATPTADVPAIELELGAKHAAFAATKSGQSRTMTERFAIAPSAGRDIVGSATVVVGAHRRNAPALIHVGAVERVEKRTEATRTLPNGTRIKEVR